MQVPRKKGLLYTVVSVVVIAVGTYLAINYAKGNYRLTQDGFSNQTGLLSANSLPTGAQVFVNDRLVTATNDTIYLEPGEYQVKIVKDGYSAWQKTLVLEPELVVQTNARLFPKAPGITPLTFTGVANISPSPDGQKILFYTATNSERRKNGLYILDLSENTLSLNKGSRQIAEDTTRIDLSGAQFIWAPDSTQLILIDNNQQLLLDANKLNDLDNMPDISFRSKQILTDWETEMHLREQQFLTKFPTQVIELVTQKAQNVYFSPDKKRLLYTATDSAQLDSDLVPALPAASTQIQQRQVEPGGIYVYDREEDRNFRVGTESDTKRQTIKKLLSLSSTTLPVSSSQSASTAANFASIQATDVQTSAANFRVYHSAIYSDTFQWHPDSRHLLFTDGSNVNVIEYDGTNTNTLYSGPFSKEFVYPWPNGSRLLILTSFSPDVPLNLYAVEIE